MGHAPETVIDSAADQFKTATNGTDATNAVQELEEVDSERTYEELSVDTAAIAAAGGLPGAMLIFDGNNDGLINADDATTGSLFGYISGGDGKIGMDNNEGEFERLKKAAQEGVIVNEDGTVLRELTFEERVAAVMLLNNFSQIEAIGVDADLTIGEGDFAAILGDQRQNYDETLYGVAAALTSFAPNGVVDPSKFKDVFKSDTVSMDTLLDMQQNPKKYNLNERQYRGVRAMLENFNALSYGDDSISQEDLINFGLGLGIDMSDSATFTQINSNQAGVDAVDTEYETVVGDADADVDETPEDDDDQEGQDPEDNDEQDEEDQDEDPDDGSHHANIPEFIERETLIQGLFRENADGVNLNTLLKARDTNNNGIEEAEVQDLIDRAEELGLDEQQVDTLEDLQSNLNIASVGTIYADGIVTYEELIKGTRYEGRSERDLSNSNEFQPMTEEEREGLLGDLFGMGTNEMTPFDALTLVPEGDEPRTEFNEEDIQRVLDNPSVWGMTDAQVKSLEELQKRFPELDADRNGTLSLEEMQAGMAEQKTVEQLTEENNVDPEKLKEMITENYRFLKEAAGNDDVLLGDEIDAALEKLPEDSTDPEVQRQREMLEYARDHYEDLAGKDGILSLDELAKAADLDREELEQKIEKEDKVARAIIKNLLMDDAAVWTEISNGEPVTEERLEAVINDPDSSPEARKYAAKLLRYFEDISQDGETIEADDLGEYALDHGVSVDQMKDYRELEREPEEVADDNGNGGTSGDGDSEGDGPHGTYNVTEQWPYDMAYTILNERGVSPITEAMVYAELVRIMAATGGPVVDPNTIQSDEDWKEFRDSGGGEGGNDIDAWWGSVQGQEITY